MLLIPLVPFAASTLALLLAAASLVRRTPSIATWSFSAGMLLLGLDSLCTGLALHAPTWTELVRWLTIGMVAKACLPAVWLAFSLTYARAEARDALIRARWVLALSAAVPLSIAVGLPGRLLDVVPPDETGTVLFVRSEGVARAFHSVLLLGLVMPLMNLEQTFRAAVGTMRWRIKYVVIGMAVIFGGYIFVRSQAILYLAYEPSIAGVESSALMVGCVFLVLAYARNGFGSLDVYPSRAVLRSSLTVLLVGGYLFIVGVLAQSVRRFGGAESFQVQAFIVLIGMAGLAVLLLSDRLRQRLQALVGRHFGKAQHDSTRLWADLSRRLAAVTDERRLAAATATLTASTFDVLAVSVWLGDTSSGRVRFAAATAPSGTAVKDDGAPGWAEMAAGLARQPAPFDLEAVDAPWAEALRQLCPSTFTSGGPRWCVPLRSAERVRGAIVLADRVNGVPYSSEEAELLQCLGDQTASALENLHLGDEVARGRELEAFRSMSAFFVHDLKNATASLNLMLKNLPVHFDDPAFRADALRGISNTVTRIDGLIERLTSLREQPGVRLAPVPLDGVLDEAVAEMGQTAVGVERDVKSILPPILADRDQLRSVVTNLLLNARDAMAGRAGSIRVSAYTADERVVLVIADNGCGMTPAFIRDSLFRPFQSTKSRGLGIGMFQARRVIEAQGGWIDVESQQGVGTTVRIILPAAEEVQTT
ncbi:Sensor protein ZraS [Luteitalea pratensis]|uniref:histidine kinase n=1 Tax=Luteitalea pratensis TaxID=1855912 RepID=A0A143PXI6_LUTPR|nr:XrtA/PEP-CTERM system histidine kinase PrsK [Luteitalea pratensis]AMY12956.1 Sensor protein ZraS [Luteitalea pratensis]